MPNLLTNIAFKARVSGRSACRTASRKCAVVTSRMEALKERDAMEWVMNDVLGTKTHDFNEAREADICVLNCRRGSEQET